jgi:drug/metabolite transporter superfamily protein YnfA
MMRLSELLLPLTTLALAAALQPLQVIAMLALLQTENGKHNGLAYLGGMTGFRLTLALVFGVLLSGVEEIVEAVGGDFNDLTGILICILGLLLLIYAIR